LVGQRLFAMALGHEDLNDHHELRHDPVMAVTGKLKARRKRRAPVAGKSTLPRLEHAPEEGGGLGSAALSQDQSFCPCSKAIADGMRQCRCCA